MHGCICCDGNGDAFLWHMGEGVGGVDIHKTDVIYSTNVLEDKSVINIYIYIPYTYWDLI